MVAKPAQSNASTSQGVFICIVYISVSAFLISFNKFLINPARFPHAMVLTALHMLSSSVLSMVLCTVFPSLFPAIIHTRGRKQEVVRFFVPLGALFAVSLYASNQVYLYCSIAFVQFIKESNIVIVFALSCAVGLQKIDRVKGLTVLWIIAGSSLCLRGELHFVLFGFGLQVLSQIAECSKNVLGEYIMTKSDLELDPASYTLFMSPVAFAFLSVGVAATWEPKVAEDFLDWWRYLLPNMLLAYSLNLLIAQVVRDCGAIGFVISGLVKDICVVIASSIAFGDIITPPQRTGFVVALSGCAVWSILKLRPHGVLARSMRAVTCMPSISESQPLSQKMKENA